MHRNPAALTDFYDNRQGIEQERVYTLLHGTWLIPFIHFALPKQVCSGRHCFVLPSQPCSQLADLHTT